MADYVVKRGDTLWGIASSYKSKIAGSTINAKIDTLVKVNNIKNRNLIYVGQKINFSSSGGSGSGSGSSSNKSASTPQRPAIVNFGLVSSSTTGRDMYVTWEHNREHTKCYTYRWEQYLYGMWTAPNADGNTTNADDRFCFSEFTADKDATKVRFRVKPVSETHKVKEGDKEVDKEYWTDFQWTDVNSATYDFSKNPPLQPPTPKAEFDPLDDTKLIMGYDSIDADGLSAKYIQFNVVKNNTASIYTSAKIAITKVSGTDKAYTVSHPYTVVYGADYKVRARSVNDNGESAWSDFTTNDLGTRPCAPKSITQYYRKKRSDGSISAYLEWGAVTNATQYTIEYTTLRENFDSGYKNWDEKTTDDARTSIEIADIAIGSNYYFRVKAVNGNGASDPTEVVCIPIGEPPAAPTTWSSSNSAFVGDPMELNWTHNTVDGSAQTWAELRLKINESDWLAYVFENTTNTTTGEQTDVYKFTYGEAVSYKGELHVKMDTTHANLKDAKVLWKVRTAGVTDEFSDTAWSADRTIYIYAKPTLELSVTSDLAGTIPFEDVTIPPENEGEEGTVIRKALTSFPFYIRGEITGLDSYEKQRPIGYHLRVVANDYYETVDSAGRRMVVNPGDAVYSKYFDTTDVLIVEMSANNIDLEPLIRYTVECNADMSTGLSVNGSDEFNVFWSDVEYTLNAEISIDETTYTAAIRPSCVDADGEMIENITMSVYRKDYNGALIEIATNVPNDGTVVTDPHPALDYARYRLIAKDTQTGAVSFYDMPGHYIGCTSVIVQWDEEWSQFETAGGYNAEGPSWSGSMLVLPYNVKVSDKRKREVSRVNYAGREYPVSYHGIAIDESSSWSTVIPKTDTETIYALRRLSLWSGEVYVREPSGMGFWANVEPSFNLDYDTLAVPVSLDITRVEGGA